MNYSKNSNNSSRLRVCPQEGHKTNQFMSNELEPQHLFHFKQLINNLFQNYDESYDQNHQLIMGKFMQVDEEIKKKGVSVKSVSKKLGLIHQFIHSAARKQVKNSHIFVLLEEHIQNVLQQDLSAILQPKKRENSISKIYNYIRDITTSKEKRGSSARGEERAEGGSLRQVTSKVMKPFAGFLRKIITSFKEYSSLVNGEYGEEETPFYWKIANWSHTLGGILKQLIRLGRYLKEDFEGVQILFVYLISVDLTMFYDILQNEVENRGNSLMASGKESPSPKQRDLIEVKELIEQSWLIKESLNTIFCSTVLQEWRKLFARSEHYKYEQTRGANSNDELLNFIQKKQKEIQKKSRGQSQKGMASNNPQTVKQEIQEKIKQFNRNPFFMQKSQSQKIDIKQEAKPHGVTPNRFASYLQGKKKEVSPKRERQTIEFGNEEDTKTELNILAKNSKIDNVRKMRLMHFTDRDKNEGNKKKK